MSGRDDGYAMAALLAGMAAMAIMMSAAMPVWKTSVTREKEAELIFRGEQYARAIGLYQRRMGPGTLPPSIDVLVDQKFLRKKYKDPITNDDFQLLSGGQAAAIQAQQGRGGTQPGPSSGTGGTGPAPTSGAVADRTGRAAALVQEAQRALQQMAGRTAGLQPAAAAGGFGQAGAPAGGIMGVVSKSTGTSFRLYNNRNKYNEWTFVFVQAAQGPGTQRPGEGGANQVTPGVLPGQRGRGQGGRGGPGGPQRGGQPVGPRGGFQQGSPPPLGRGRQGPAF